MIKTLKKFGFIALLGFTGSACISVPIASAQGELLKRKTTEETILEKLRQARPDINFGEPRPAVIKGLYQVQVPGGPLLFVTPEGDKFIAGEVFGIDASGFSKIEDPYVIEERKKALASLNSKDSIVFKPKGKTKAVVYVFTDIDCGYCRKLHSQMHTYNEGGQEKPGYNDLGIEIRYLAYPRAGIPSPSADKLISTWCAKDKQDAMTKLKAGQTVANAVCDNPVAKQFQLGGQLGVNGTPALFLPDGKLMPGYLPPEELAKTLGI
ncbi:DsbC family protein [Cellvibrio fontiphilus]|uniref:Thiol:disulfide interchange protein n=1 Tax=Cellvibrio fontiphilus TaxID=1815559 RepID=A0ABV7FLR5_9GAMM